MTKQLHFARPLSVSEATTLLANHPTARIIAGGTDLLVKWKNGILPDLTHLVDLGNLKLTSIAQEGDHIAIGSGCTMSQIAEHPLVKKKFPALVTAALQVGALQIRNLATLGGNVANASPAGDTIPALLTLEAQVRLAGIKGVRLVPLAKFFTGPGKTEMEAGDLIEAFLIPDRETKGTFFKLGERRAHAISKVSLALSSWAMPGSRIAWRIALGAVAPTVIRARRAETLLEGASESLTEKIIEQACQLVCEEATPISDIRSEKEYRKKMVGVLLKRALEKLKKA